MQAILLEKVFYGIPKHMGFFDVKEVGALAMNVTPRGTPIQNTENKDDAFLNANSMA